MAKTKKTAGEKNDAISPEGASPEEVSLDEVAAGAFPEVMTVKQAAAYLQVNEQVLYRYPGVVEAAVFGVPDEQWGEAVKAVVALKHGTKATEEEIIAFCRENITHYKAPRAVEFRESLPKSEVSGEVTTTTTAIEALQISMQAERASIELYRRMEKSTTDPGAKVMFDELVAEEQAHLLLLEAQYRAIEKLGTFIIIDEFAR